MSFNTIIETGRLILRPFTMDDVEPSYQMNLDEEITLYTNDGGVKTRAEIHKTIKTNVLGDYEKHGFGRLAVILKSENAFIGFTGLKYLPEYNLVDLGYRLRRDCWGKGIATEGAKASMKFAFNDLKLPKVVGFIIPDNIASARILTKLNFKFEKELYEDEILLHQYSILNINNEK